MHSQLLARTGLTLLLLLAPRAVLARQSPTDAEVSRLAKLSHQQYQAGDYANAAETLLKAYELKPVSTLLFNIAKTYEKAGNDEQAMRFYQRYLDAEDADPKLVRQASRALERLRLVADERHRQEQKAAEEKAAQERAAQEKAAAEQAAKAPEPVPDATATRTPAAPTVRDVPTARPGLTQPAPRSSGKRAIAFVAIGVGAASVGAGVVFGLSAHSAANDEKASTDPIQKPDLRSQAHSRALLADIAYGVGAAALVTGVVLLVTDHPAPAVQPQVMLLDHGAAVALGGDL